MKPQTKTTPEMNEEVVKISLKWHNASSDLGPETPGGGGRFNFVCTGLCRHTVGKLTHPQTTAGLSINKTDPFPDCVQYDMN